MGVLLVVMISCFPLVYFNPELMLCSNFLIHRNNTMKTKLTGEQDSTMLRICIQYFTAQEYCIINFSHINSL